MRPEATAPASAAAPPAAFVAPPFPQWPPLGEVEKTVAILASCIPLIGLFVGALYLGARSPHRRAFGKTCIVIAGLSILVAWFALRPFWFGGIG